MDKVNNEAWKTLPEVPFIEVSSFGKVRTRDRVVPCKGNGKRIVKGHVLKPQDIGNGYVQVGFRKNGKYVRRYVHRLVAECFLQNPNNLPQVNHLDCNRANNNVNNLEWCTHDYNCQYRNKYGVSYKEAAPKSPVFAVNLTTLEVSNFPSQMEAGRSLGIDYKSINSVIKGRYKTSKGYWFTNANNKAVEATRDRFDDIVANKVKKLMAREGKVEQQCLNDFVNEMQPA